MYDACSQVAWARAFLKQDSLVANRASRASPLVLQLRLCLTLAVLVSWVWVLISRSQFPHCKKGGKSQP